MLVKNYDHASGTMLVKKRNHLYEKIRGFSILPVVKVKNADDSEPLADALCAGNLPCAEITFRTDACPEVIRRMKGHRPEMLIGAGTVLKKDQVDQAIEAGAEFIVSPGCNPSIVSYCLEQGIPIIPGCATPSEIELAMQLGIFCVKFFPAEAFGGVKMIQALSAPYPDIRFLPTGGIRPENLQQYLELTPVLACGGSWIASEGLLEQGAFDQITQLAKNASVQRTHTRDKKR